MREMRIRKQFMIFLAVLAALLGSHSVRAQTPLPRVKLGVVTPWQVGAFYLPQHQGWYREAGVDVEIVKFAVGPAIMEAIASKSIDMGYVGGAPAFLAAARGADFRVVAGTYDTSNLFGLNPVVRTSITSVQGLKGKTILVPLGTLPHLHTLMLLDKFGLAATDVKLQHMQFSEIASSFTVGIGDAAVPFWTQCLDLVEKGQAKFLTVDGRPIRLDQPPGKIIRTKLVDVVVARGDLVTAQPDTVMRFLRAYFRGIDWIRANPQEALTAFQAVQKKDVGVELSANTTRELHKLTEWLAVEPQLSTLFNKESGEGSLYADGPFILSFFARQGVDVKPVAMDKTIDPSFLAKLRDERKARK